MTGSVRSSEIERQFMMTQLPPDLERYSCVHIRQGYLSVSEEREIRIRAAADHYSLTIKDGQGLAREETEITLSEAQFSALWPATGTNRIEKLRYDYPMGKHSLLIDCYQGALQGFNVLEVEFASVAESERFTPPAFCGEEITEKGSVFYLKELLAGR